MKKIRWAWILGLALLAGLGLYGNHYLNQQHLPEGQQELAGDLAEKKDLEDLESAQEAAEEEEEEVRVEEIQLLAAGDLMFHSQQITAAQTDQGYDFWPVFAQVAPYFQEADLSLVNLETVTDGPESDFTGYPLFNTPDEILDALKKLGVDLVSTANNHSLDRGKSGLLKTIDKIQARGMQNVGTYRPGEKKPLISSVAGIKLGVLSYTYGLNGLDSRLTDEERPQMINLIQEDLIQADIQAIRDQVDGLIVFLHWGTEYQRQASSQQRALAEKIFDWGADIILGSHPHVIQEAEFDPAQNRYIIYSMGNFLSDQRAEYMGFDYSEDGVMVSLTLEKDFSQEGIRIKEVREIPTWVRKYRPEGKTVFEILPMEEGQVPEDLPAQVQERMKRSYANTRKALDGEG